MFIYKAKIEKDYKVFFSDIRFNIFWNKYFFVKNFCELKFYLSCTKVAFRLSTKNLISRE